MTALSRLRIFGMAALLPLSMLLGASQAWALFDGQLLVGKRWYEVESDNSTDGISSQEVTVGAHVDPIPLVPVAAGATVSMMTLDKDDLGDGWDEASVFEAGIEVMGWLPMVPFVTPYAKLNYPVVGEWVQKGSITVAGESQDVVMKRTVSGLHTKVGVKYSPLPLMSILLETGMANQTAEVDTYEVGDQDSSDLVEDSLGFNSDVFLVGVEVGI